MFIDAIDERKAGRHITQKLFYIFHASPTASTRPQGEQYQVKLKFLSMDIHLALLLYIL
jgi:hypothetical protein